MLMVELLLLRGRLAYNKIGLKGQCGRLVMSECRRTIGENKKIFDFSIKICYNIYRK